MNKLISLGILAIFGATVIQPAPAFAFDMPADSFMQNSAEPTAQAEIEADAPAEPMVDPAPDTTEPVSSPALDQMMAGDINSLSAVEPVSESDETISEDTTPAPVQDSPEALTPEEAPREPEAPAPAKEKFIEITDPAQIREITNSIGDLTPSLKILDQNNPLYDKSQVPADHPDWLPVVNVGGLKLNPKVIDIQYYYDPKTGKYYQSEDLYQPPAADANVPDIAGKKPMTFDAVYQLVKDMKLKVGDKIVVTYKNAQGKIVQETRVIEDILRVPYREGKMDGSVDIWFQPVKGQDPGIYISTLTSATATVFAHGKTYTGDNVSGDVIYSIERPGTPVAPAPRPAGE